jgi:hypothetical protein
MLTEGCIAGRILALSLTDPNQKVPRRSSNCPGRGKERKDLPMQDESSRMPADDEEWAEKGILSLLLASDSQRPWSVAELERERGEHLGTSMQSQVCTPRA